MKKGHIITLVGVLFFLISVGVIPFRVVTGPLEVQALPPHLWEHEILEESITGIEAWPLQVAAAFAGLAALAALAGLFVRPKRRLAQVTLLFGLAQLGLSMYALAKPASVLGLPEEASAVLIGGVWENLLLFASLMLSMLGGVWVLASRVVFKPGDRLCRVALLWDGDVLKERVVNELREVTVGDDRRATFPVPAKVAGLGARTTVLRRQAEGIFQLQLLAGMSGRLHVNDVTHKVEDFIRQQGGAAGAAVTLQTGDWCLINLGSMSLYIQATTPQERPIILGAFETLDLNMAGTTLLAAVAQVAVILLGIFMWEPEIRFDKLQEVRKLMKVEFQAREEQKEEELLDLGEEDDTTGKKAEGEEGKFGDPDVDPEIESKVPKRDGKMVSKIDPKQVGLNDLLSTSKLGGKGAISNILASSSSGFANKLAVAMSGTGVEFVMGHGSGGLGFRGTGTGGGGTGGYGRIHGLGRIDTGGGVGMKGSLGRKTAARVGKIDFGGGSSQGFCEKGAIQRVVRMRAGAIRACYEQQLQIKPNLAGKITCRWTIGLDGSVTAAAITQSTLGNAAVENCVMRTIRRMRFKKPEGGICIVQWPFVFNPS